MKIAWFAPAASAPDDTASLVAELRARHEVARFDASTAHDFVWQHARVPFDACVYELNDTPASAFVWPYLLRYPGVLRLRAASLRASRGALLGATRMRDYQDELRASRPRMLGVPVLASRLVVVTDEAFARALSEEYPDAHVAHAPLGVDPLECGPLAAQPVVFGIHDASMAASARRAAQRALEAGATLQLRDYASAADAVRDSHVLLAMRWPPGTEPPVDALLGMSAARAVIVHEAESTAAWPALDPQTWTSRDLARADAPVVVSIDPRDEEHSLMLSMRRLAGSVSLREQLGRAAQAWWRSHATPAIAANAWASLLARAAATPPPARQPGWPAHLMADGTERARETLRELGVSVDFLD